MPFKLCSTINIGDYQFNGGVTDLVIKRSVKEIVDTAVIRVPALGSVLGTDLPNSSVKTSTLFKEGDLVIIQLGYNGQYQQEFKGFVRRVTASTPVEIECEGYAWQLRRVRLAGYWKSIFLPDFLKLLVAGTGIQLSGSIPNIPLTNLKLDRPNGLKVLEYIKDSVHLSSYFMFDTLYVGLEEGLPGKQVGHSLGWNTIKDDKLKYRDAADTLLQIRFKGAKGKNVKTPLLTAGDDEGSVVTYNFANVTDQATANQIINDILQQQKYTGLEGSFTAFLQPFIQMCDTDVITDPIYKVRQGSYFVQGVEVRYGMNGATREVSVGRSLG